MKEQPEKSAYKDFKETLTAEQKKEFHRRNCDRFELLLPSDFSLLEEIFNNENISHKT